MMRDLGLITRAACHQFSTKKGKGVAARYEVGPVGNGCNLCCNTPTLPSLYLLLLSYPDLI